MELKEEFFNKVYGIVSEIPEGKVISYGEIAKRIGEHKRSRYVGYAMKNVPAEANLPCHRVIKHNGELAPSHVFESLEVQRAMLLAEGVAFDKKGRVKRCCFL